jgi:predicted O-methyltransferase YrrM
LFTDSLHQDFPPQHLRMAKGAQGRSADSSACGSSRAEATLAALHADGAGWSGRWVALRALLGSLLRPAAPACAACPHRPISAQCGALLYQLARLGDARLAVTLGAGDAAATIWLACAMRANHRHAGDRGIIACEPAHELAQLARCRLRAAGVSRYVDLREGQPEQALARIDQPVDCLLFNGYPVLMLPVLKLLQDKLRPGATVLALRPRGERQCYSGYLRYVRDPRGGFTSIALPCSEGLELSVRN